MDAQRRWVFKSSQGDNLMADAIAEHMYRSGVRTAAFIGFDDDAYGDGWLAEAKRAHGVPGAMELVAVGKVWFKRGRRPMPPPRCGRLMAAHPDAVLVGGSGSDGGVAADCRSAGPRLHGQGITRPMASATAVLHQAAGGQGRRRARSCLPAPMLVADAACRTANTAKSFGVGLRRANMRRPTGPGTASPRWAPTPYDAGIMLRTRRYRSRCSPPTRRGPRPSATALRDGLEIGLWAGTHERRVRDDGGGPQRLRQAAPA